MLWLRDHKAAIPAAQVVPLIEDKIGLPLAGVRQLLKDPAHCDWPHFRQLKALPVMDLMQQENFLKDHILLYFGTADRMEQAGEGLDQPLFAGYISSL